MRHLQNIVDLDFEDGLKMLLIRHAGSQFARRNSVRIESNQKVPRTNRLSLEI